MKTSAGLLLYRYRAGSLEMLLAHPGGPLWAKKDLGAWSIPKGEVEEGEDPLAVAIREFAEETGSRPQAAGLLDLGTVRQRAGKTVRAWAGEGDLDPDALVSNTFTMEWPPRSGRHQEFPEVDRVAWFGPAEARAKVNPAQALLIDRLEESLGSPRQ